jgi:hypothetical protein
MRQPAAKASQLHAVTALARLDPARAVERVLDHALRGRVYTAHLDVLCGHATEADAERVIPVSRPTERIFENVHASGYLDRLVRLQLGRFGDRGREEVGRWVGWLAGQARARAEWGLRV